MTATAQAETDPAGHRQVVGPTKTGQPATFAPELVGGQDTSGNVQPFKMDPLGGLLPGGPIAANILNGQLDYTSGIAATTLITIPAGRTWVGVIGASVAAFSNAAVTSLAQSKAIFTTAGTGVTPAAGTVFTVEALGGGNAIGGTTGTQGNNFGSMSLTVIAPAGNSVTIQVASATSGSTATGHCFASGQLL